MNTFTNDIERILYEGEVFLYLHERILFRYFLENSSLGKRCFWALELFFFVLKLKDILCAIEYEKNRFMLRMRKNLEEYGLYG